MLLFLKMPLMIAQFAESDESTKLIFIPFLYLHRFWSSLKLRKGLLAARLHDVSD
jgi:hypothetical protein